MNRPRSRQHRELPDNLYRKPDKRTGKTYYSYKDPRSGKYHGMGTDHALAVEDAKALNAAIYQAMRVAKIASVAQSKPDTPPLSRLMLRHLDLCEKRRLSANTMKSRWSMVRAWERELGAERPIGEIVVRDFVEVIDKYEAAGKVRMAQSMRSAAIDIWKDAIAEGWAGDNLPAKTRAPSPQVKRARLLLDDFTAIRAAAQAMAARQGRCVENAMLLALLSGQRREDVGSAQFKRGPDWKRAWRDYQEDPKANPAPYPFIEDGMLWVVQGKTGALVRIPLSLRLEATGMSLSDVVERCRATNVVSRYLIHHDRPFVNAPVGSPLHVDTISRQFASAREATGRSWAPKEPPTFHELRSLAERLYRDQGIDVQTLLGHRAAKMTAVYDDLRQADWRTIQIG
jgi:enterobacteria phage integrase